MSERLRAQIGDRAAWSTDGHVMFGQIIDIRDGTAHVACLGWPRMEQVPVVEYTHQVDGVWRGCQHVTRNAAGVCVDCLQRSLLALEADPAGDLLAYGEQERESARIGKDREQYQFWSGWVAALQRLTPVATTKEKAEDV